MFCRHCGKELSDDSKFCIECGTAVDGTKMDTRVSINNTEWKRWVVLGCSLVSALGIFMPILIANTYWGCGYNLSFNLLNFFELFHTDSDIYSLLIDDFFDEGRIRMIALVPILIAVLAAVTTLIGVVLLFNVTGSTEDVISIGKVIAILGIIYPVFTAIFIFIENRIYLWVYPDEYMQFFELTVWEWLLLIVAVINLCVCNSEKYRNKEMVNES